jgi:2-dehydropantoate 2-reductase
MRLLVVGAGSTGGYFGGRLAQAGRDVTFLVRPRRASQLRESGLQIVSPHGNVTVRPKLVTANEIEAPYDAVLLGVKAYSLDAAIDDFAAAVGPETTIIPTLNGMRHIEILEERFGKEPVAGGVCKVAATIDPDGRIVQLAQFQELAYGERDGSVSQRMERLHAFMQGAGFDARLSHSIEYETPSASLGQFPDLPLCHPRDLLDWYVPPVADHGRIVLPSHPLALSLQFFHPGADGREIVRSAHGYSSPFCIG